MNSPAAKPSGKLDENQRKALISLLADEDLAVYRTVRQNLLSQGPIAAQWLRQHTLSNDPLLRRRAQEITDHFSRINADTDLLAFCLNQGEDFDLEQGVLLRPAPNIPTSTSKLTPPSSTIWPANSASAWISAPSRN